MAGREGTRGQQGGSLGSHLLGRWCLHAHPHSPSIWAGPLLAPLPVSKKFLLHSASQRCFSITSPLQFCPLLPISNSLSSDLLSPGPLAWHQLLGTAPNHGIKSASTRNQWVRTAESSSCGQAAWRVTEWHTQREPCSALAWDVGLPKNESSPQTHQTAAKSTIQSHLVNWINKD